MIMREGSCGINNNNNNNNNNNVGRWLVALQDGDGSVVIKDVPPRTTVVGNTAKLVGGKNGFVKLDKISIYQK